MAHHPRWAIGTIIVHTVLVAVLAGLLPGFTLGGAGGAVVGALVISLALALAWPFIYRFSARFHPLVFPLLTFALTGVVVFLAGQADVALFDIDDVWTGILVTMGLTIGNVVVGALFSLNDTRGYDWFVVRPLRHAHAATPKTAEPGILRRTDGFGYAPDILVNSCYDPATGEEVAFEELVGCHGGFGRPQTQPFVLFPADLAAPDGPSVGAAALDAVVKGWRTASSGTHAKPLGETAANNVWSTRPLNSARWPAPRG